MKNPADAATHKHAKNPVHTTAHTPKGNPPRESAQARSAENAARDPGSEAKAPPSSSPSTPVQIAALKVRGVAQNTEDLLSSLNARLQELSDEIAHLNPAVLREPAKKPRRKKGMTIAQFNKAQEVLRAFRKARDETVATSAIRLLLHNCGKHCTGCPHASWAVWKPGRALKAGHTPHYLLRLQEPGDQPADTPSSVRSQVMAYARRAADPRTKALVREAFAIIEMRRKILAAHEVLAKTVRELQKARSVPPKNAASVRRKKKGAKAPL